MFRPRIIPCLLLKNKGLVKTVKFKNPVYIGDPINTVRIFNQKKADELIFLDITATNENRCVSLDLIQKIGNEAYMPTAVGGGIKTIEQIKKILNTGAEKVIINTAAFLNPNVIKEAANIFGSQSIAVSIDVLNNEVYIFSGTKKTVLDPVTYAQKAEALGAGEIFLNSIEKDGAMKGYDIELIKKVTTAVSIPVIASGGAGSIKDFQEAIQKGKASACSAGSLFVFHGPRKAVLISYPSRKELKILTDAIEIPPFRSLRSLQSE